MKRSTLVALLGLLITLHAVFPQSVVATDVGKNFFAEPARTWVFIVGVLKWQQAAGMASFSEKNRRDEQLRDWFVKSGVPSDHIVYLADTQATLSQIDSELNAMLAKTRPGDTMFAYYCGHGWVTSGKAYLGNYDAGKTNDTCWSVKSFVNTLATKYKGGNLLVTADCCHSGSIGEELAKAKPPFNYATVTSAISATSSTGNWTFTQALLDCLRGHRYADADNDGNITYEELAKYVNAEMSGLERQSAAAERSAVFDPKTVIAGVQFKNEAVPERVQVKWNEKWYPAKILERKGDRSLVRWVTIGWDTSDSDEWVTADRIKKSAPVNTAMPASSAKNWSAGDKVSVLWGGKWYPAVIKKYNNGQYFVHYDGYESTDDEWVQPTAIK